MDSPTFKFFLGRIITEIFLLISCMLRGYCELQERIKLPGIVLQQHLACFYSKAKKEGLQFISYTG